MHWQAKTFSLWQQIAILSLCAVIVVSFTAGEIIRTFEKEYLVTQLETQTKQLLSVVSGATVDAMITEDVDIMETVTEQVAANSENLIAVIIENKAENILVQWKHENFSEVNLISFSKLIFFEKEFLGRMVMKWDLTKPFKLIENHVHRIRIFLFTSLLVLTVIIVTVVYGMTVYPIKKIDLRLTEIAKGHLTETITIESSKEMNHLANSVNLLSEILYRKGLLENEHKEQLEKLNQAYYRFVPHELLTQLSKSSILDVKLGDQIQKNMSVLFADIRSFTTISENMTPEDNFQFLNAYFRNMEPVIRRNAGFIDKFIGDAIMALFVNGDHAVDAGIEMLETLQKYNKGRARAGYPAIKIGIGLNSGSLMLGTIGGENRMDGTVISDAVNIASRIEGFTKAYGSTFLISHFSLDVLEDRTKYQIRFIDKVAIKGRSNTIMLFEVFNADPPELIAAKIKAKPFFDEAIELYFKQQFTDAVKRFQECLQVLPYDKTIQIYVKRCLFYQINPPPADWDGIAYLNPNQPEPEPKLSC